MRKFGFACALAAAWLAATPALAGEARLHWKDLDLGTEAGKAELDRRIDLAAQLACTPEAATGSRIAARKPAPACVAQARTTMTAQVATKVERERMAKAQGSTAVAARH